MSALTANQQTTYQIYAKDKVGRQSELLKTFVFIPYSIKPALGTTLEQADPTNYALENTDVYENALTIGQGDTAYDVRVFTGDSAHFTLPVQASSLPAASKDVHYKITYNNNTTVPESWSSAVDVGTSQKLENVEIALNQISDSRTAPTLIYVWYRDAIGNTKVYNLPYPGTSVNKWMKDTTNPKGTIDYDLLLDDGTSATNTTDTDSWGHYFEEIEDPSVENTTVTVIYNPAYVKKLNLTSNVIDNYIGDEVQTDTSVGIGLDARHLYYKVSGSEEYHLINDENRDNIILNFEDRSTVTYEIYAKDRVGHISALLKTFVFKPFGTVPEVVDEDVTYSGIATEKRPQYNNAVVKGFAAVDSQENATDYATPENIEKITENSGTRVFTTTDTTVSFTVPVADLPSEKLFYAVKYYTADNIEDFAVPSADDDDWNRATNVTSTSGTQTISVDMASLSKNKSKPTFIFVWFKDEINNICVHNLTYHYEIDDIPVIDNCWMWDHWGPTGSLASYNTFWGEDMDKIQRALSSQPGTYTIEDDYDDEGSFYVSYSPTYVEQLRITSGITDFDSSNNGVGLFTDHLYYKNVTEDGELTKIEVVTNSQTGEQTTYYIIDLPAEIPAGETDVVYDIYAKDRVGNISARLKRFRFKPHSSVPQIYSEISIPYTNYLVSDLEYNSTVIKGFGSYTSNNNKYMFDDIDDYLEQYNSTHYKIADGAKLTLPIDRSKLPSDYLWCAITYNSVEEPVLDSESWQRYSVTVAGDGNGKIENVPIDISKITSSTTFIFVWYMDELGNISVHTLTHPYYPSSYYLWTRDGVHNVTYLPLGAVTGRPQTQTGNNATLASSTASGDYLESGNTYETNFIYNPQTVKTLKLDLTSISSNSGAGFDDPSIYYKVGTSTNLIPFDGTTGVTAGNFGEITLGQVGDEDYADWKAGKTYRIVAKDKLGFTNVIKTFILKAHETVPQASEQNVEYDGTAPTYNSSVIKGFDGTNYSVSTTSSVGISEIQEDLGKIKVFTGATSFTFPVTASSLPSLMTNSNRVYYAVTYDSNVPSSWQGPVDVYSTGKISNVSIDLTSVSASKAAPSYLFVWYKDEIGNISVHNLPYPGTTDNRWMADTTAPAVAAGETSGVKAYSITGDNAVDSTNGNLGTYYTSDSTANGKPKTTVTYNPAYVNKITLTSGVADAGVGLDTYHLYYKQGSSYVLIPNNEITLGNSNASYEIYAKDRVGHVSELLKTFEFVAHGTVPSTGTGKETTATYSGVTTEPSYNSSEVKSFVLAANSITNSDNIDISSATDSNDDPINVFINNTVSTFTIPMSAGSLPSTKLYYAVQYYTKENISSFAEPAAADWTSTTVSDTATTINVDISPANISTSINAPTFIFVWYRDQVGNISVHNVPYAGCLQNMWMKDGTAPTGALNNWTLKKENGSTASGASATSSGDYLETSSDSEVSIYYNPDVVKTITFAPQVTDNENGVGLSSDYLWYSTTQGGTTVQIANKTITLSSTDAETYFIYAKDKVGNKSTLLKKYVFNPKSGGPAGSVTGTPKKANGDAVTLVTSSSNISGDYIVENGNKYIYNPEVVKKFVLDASAVTDSVVGVTTDTCLWYGTSASSLTNGNEITLPQSGSATYYVYAKDKVGNISEEPLATFEFVAHSAKPSAADEGSVQINGTTYNTFGTNTDFTVSSTVGNIAENTAEINVVTAATTFTLPVTAGNLPSARLYYSLTYNSVDEPSNWSAPVNVSSGKLTGIQIALNSISDSKDEPTYIYVWYKDEIGNVSIHSLTYPGTIRNLWMKDFAGPTGTVTGTPKKAGGNAAEAGDTTYGDYIVNENTITYNPDVVTKIALGDTDVSDAGVGFINGRLWYKAGADGELTNGTEISLSEVTSTTTYYVYAKDRVGNISSNALGTFTLVPDSTAPALKANGAITGTPKKANEEAATEVTSESTASGDYIKTTSGSTVTINYNPSVVKKFALDASDVEDSVAGLTNISLWYKEGADGTLTNGSEITLPASGEKTYYIYAKDKIGNITSDALATFVFKAYATAPAAGTGKTTTVTYADVAYASTPSVKAFVITADNVSNKDDIKVITEQSNNIEVFTTGITSTFTLPVEGSALPSTKLYYAIQYLDKTSITANLTAPETGWSYTTVASDATSVSLAIPATSVSTSKAAPTFIFVWYKDELGNAGVYNIAFPRAGENDSTVYHNLWMKDTTAPAGTVGSTPRKIDGEFSVPATNVADATSGIGDYVVSTSGGTVTYRYNPAVVTSVELSTSDITEEGVGIEALYRSTTEDGNETLTEINNYKITLSGNAASTYIIKAKDKVGNVSGVLTTIVFEPDSAAPQGSVGYFLKDSNSETVAAHTDSASGAYHADVDTTTNTSTITYNPAVVKTINLTSTIQDKGGLSDSDAGVGLPATNLFFKIDDSTTLSDYSDTITLDSSWNGKKYIVIGKDKVGNEATIRTFIFKAHGTAPETTTQTVSYGTNVTAPTYNSVAISGFGTATTHYSMSPAATEVMTGEGESQTGTGVYKFAAATQEAPNTTFTLPVTLSSLPTSKVYYALTYNSVLEPASWSGPVTVTDDETTGNQITDVTIDMSKVTGSKVFIFVWLKDELGNITVRNLTVPGSAVNLWTTEASQNTGYDPMVNVSPEPRKANGSAALLATNTTRGDYFVNSSGKIIYNPQSVKKLGFITNEGTTLTYKIGDNGDYTAMTNNELDISSFTAETTVKVKATDAFGNTTTNRTAYVIQPDSSAPTVDSSYVRDNKFLKGYTAKAPDGSNISAFSQAQDSVIWNGGWTNYYTLGTKIFFAKNKITDSLTDVVSYKYATSRDVQAQSGNYAATVSNTDTDWMPMEVSGDNYSFELPDITTPNSHIALCFMDSVGNVSQVYWLDKIDGKGNDWWITAHELTANDISISSSPATFPGKNKTATLTITLPKGMVVKTVAYTDCSQDGNINFSDYAQGDANWSGTDNKSWININTMTVKVKFTNDSGSGAKITINGVSKKIF